KTGASSSPSWISAFTSRCSDFRCCRSNLGPVTGAYNAPLVYWPYLAFNGWVCPETDREWGRKLARPEGLRSSCVDKPSPLLVPLGRTVSKDVDPVYTRLTQNKNNTGGPN